MSTTLPLLDENAPQVPLAHLDELWFQVGGTLCNLECTHCFISCSPRNESFGFLDLATVREALEQSKKLGVKEYYFTGGEPFLNRDMVAILECTLSYGPATALTNGTVFKDESLACLQQAEAQSPYSLEIRVSIDGFTAEENDRLRGQGSFDRAIAGVRKLLAYGFLPIITVTQVDGGSSQAELFHGFVALLKSQGYSRPRIKILPTLRIGAEAGRCRPYESPEHVTREMLEGFNQSHLLCHHSRIVTNRGVYVCPILIEAPDARLGDRLEESLQPFSLRHRACYTCYQHGTICANVSSGPRDA